MAIKPNAKNRSRRLRKKLHVDEFQEFGFEVAIRFEDGVDTEEAVVAIVDHWLVDAMDKNGLMFGGSSSHLPGSLGGVSGGAIWDRRNRSARPFQWGNIAPPFSVAIFGRPELT